MIWPIWIKSTAAGLAQTDDAIECPKEFARLLCRSPFSLRNHPSKKTGRLLGSRPVAQPRNAAELLLPKNSVRNLSTKLGQ